MIKLNYDQLLTLKNTIWTEEECQKFVQTFQHPTYELVQFGKISEFLNATKEELEICTKSIFSQEQLKEIGMKDGFFHIISEYKRLKNKYPADDVEAFLDFVS